MRFFIQDLIPAALPDSVPAPSKEISMLKSLPFDELINSLVTGMVKLAINIAIALVVFYVGKFIIRKIYNLVARVLIMRHIDQGLRTFLLSMVRIVLYFILIVTVIGILGIETSSFLAIFASAGVAMGMALSGTLQNFAGGVLILMLKPYRIGDYIETQGYAGTVREIQLFNTIINTYDNKSITLPNGGLSTGSINNWSREKYRRVDWTVSISYGDDVDVARSTILDILRADSRVMDKAAETPEPVEPETPADNDVDEQTPEQSPRRGLLRMFRRHRRIVEQKAREARAERRAALAELNRPVYNAPAVVLDQLADSAVVLKVRAWTLTTDYWAVYYDINEAIYKRLPQAGITFPFPQLDVHLPVAAPAAAGAD